MTAAFSATTSAPPHGFAKGTLILTIDGPVFVEDLHPGDRVLTRDHGPQHLKSLGRSLSTDRAITVAPEAIGPGLPWRHLRLAPQQRVLVAGWKAELLFGTDEVLVAVGDLVSDGTILAQAAIGATPLYHLAFDAAQIIWAEGIEVEVPAQLPQTAGLPAALTAPETQILHR